MEDYEKLLEEVVSYAGGLPLALTVLGCFLCDKNISQWKSALDRLKEIPDKDILGKLRISFDGLEPVEKDMFLDIACFFRWEDTSKAMKLLDACGFHPVIGIEVLKQKTLIVITEDGRFDMHDLVQEMRHYIVREKHPKNPEKHSRVWKWEDACRILAMDATTYLPNLTHMELVDMPNLIKTPDVSGLPNLETFKLDKCPCLEGIHHSIGCLERLVFLSVDHCPRLRMFPSVTRMKKLETLLLISCEKLEIISEIQQQEMDNSGCSSFFSVEYCLPHNNMNRRGLRFLHSVLRKLDLKSCCLGDVEISYDFWELPNVEELNLSYNPLISVLDFSILRLPRLKWLDVSYCKGLVGMLELPSSIAVVIADSCESLESFGDISSCKWLWKASLRGENEFDQLPGDTLIQSMLQGNAIENHFISVVLQHHIPNAVVRRLFKRHTFRLHLLDDWYNDFCGFLICIVTDANCPKINVIIKQEDAPFDISWEPGEVVEHVYHYGVMTCAGYVSFSSLRHTTLLTSSYNIISLTIEDPGYMISESTYVGIELIRRKKKSDEVQTTDCSEFWDEKLQDARLNTFTIQQYDSDSSIKISWKPFGW